MATQVVGRRPYDTVIYYAGHTAPKPHVLGRAVIWLQSCLIFAQHTIVQNCCRCEIISNPAPYSLPIRPSATLL